MASKRSKVPLALVFIFSLAAVGALLAAAATPHWVAGVAVRQNLTDNERPQVPDENGQIPPFTGYIQFGLFNGEKIFNFGFTQRAPVYFSIFEEHAEVYSIGFPIAAFVSVLIAAIFGLVSTIFGLVNTITVPIETIHGPVGLYVWNGIGAVCSLVAWVIYLALLLTKLTTNILNKSDIDPPNNFRTDSVSFAYSYWLVVVACALFILNLICVFLAKLLSDPDFLQQRRGEKEFSKGENNVGMDEMMY
ncbi:clarin-1-like [Acanthaster planci]|uniref:Clarin-1-like n=1 Tax=Acanthaster planci TaxID=133434 RepID=A0A8B7ZMR5_ACAPL|nr:clarin-1-like [Acanthaster planci]